MYTNLKNVEIAAPYFPGFYNSVFDTNLDNFEADFYAVFHDKVNNDTYNMLFKEMEGNRWDYFNGEEYQNAIGKKYASNFEDALTDIDGMPSIKVKFIKIESPMYYNYSTDKCIVRLSGISKQSMAKIVKLMEKWESELRERIKEDWSSRSGFWSFVDNNYDHWLRVFKLEKEALREYAQVTETSSGRLHNMIGVILGYLIEFENTDWEWDLIYNTLDDVCEFEFIDYDALLAKFNLSWRKIKNNSRQLDLVDYINNLEK